MNKKLVFEYYSRLLDKLIDEHDYFKYLLDVFTKMGFVFVAGFFVVV